MAGMFTDLLTLFSNNAAAILVGFVILLFMLNTMRGKTSKSSLPYPPGPWGFPVLGHLPLLGKNPPATMAKYREQYGDVFSIRMGSYPTVVINGLGTIRSALTDHLDDFAARPKLYTAEALKQKNGKASGLTFTEFNAPWKVHRKITNNALRMFATYKNNPVEEIIREEGERFVDFLLKQGDSAVDIKNEMYLMVGSVIYQIMFGRQNDLRADDNFAAVIRSNLDFSEFSNAGNPVDVMPWTRFILPWKITKFLEIIGNMMQAYKIQLKKHQQTYDDRDLRDVMDALLKSSKDLTDEDTQMGLSTEVICSVVPDLLGAGFETVGTTLMWSILLMVTYPEIQQNVQKEIDQQLGQFHRPTYEDRKRLPYVEATLLEIQRFGSILPFAIPHATTKDVELKGYSIPKDTFVFINQDSTCKDKAVWDDPENFRPARFLSSDGEVDTNKAEMFLRFGAGRRRCLGEFLAKVELFLFFTIVMQKCSFSKAPGEEYSLEGQFGLTMRPPDYKVSVTSRHQ